MNKEQRGEEARRLLEHPLLKEAFVELERITVNRLATVGMDWDKSAPLLADLSAVRRLRNYLEQLVTTGTLSAMEDKRRKFPL